MPVLSITARFPLGVFLGHGRDGSSRDGFPDTARLHAALMQAAGKGVTAVERHGDLRPSGKALMALEWLETHPPTALMHPQRQFVRGRREVVSYRADGVFDVAKGSWRDRKAPRSISDGVALASDFGWRWDDAPTEVVSVVESLCPDVSCLGEADSPVLLRVAPFEPTHFLEQGAGQFSARGIGVRTPAPGRTESLEAAYDKANPVKRPSLGADRLSQSQLPSPTSVVGEGTRTRFYAPPTASPVEAPWVRVQVFPVNQEIPLDERVPWCVAFHRMLAHRLGDTAPPVLTGAYQRGVPVPANRVAIHYVQRSGLAHLGLDSGGFLVMLPQAMSDPDLLAYLGATSGRLSVYRREARLNVHCEVEIAGDEFWPVPVEGERRVWWTLPAMVAETRRQPDSEEGPWTLEHAALLSLAFVFRDRFGVVAKGTAGYRQLVQQVRATGARVISAVRVADSRVDRYAHKLPVGLMTQPCTACLDLGSLAGPRTLIAVGQARHVGGGMLYPTPRSGESDKLR